MIAFVLAILGFAGTRVQIDFVTPHAFWFVIAAYVLLALGCVIDGL